MQVKIILKLEGSQASADGIKGVTAALGGMSTAGAGGGSALREVAAASQAATGGLTRTSAAAREGSNALDGLTQRLGAYAAGLGVVSKLQQALGARDDFAGLRARLDDLEGSAAAGGAALEQVFAIAQRQGAELDAVGGAYARVGASVRKMGGDSTDTARIIETVAASLRLNKATAAETTAVMLQFGQAMGKGRVNGDEFMSLMENAPRLMDAVAASLGKNKAELFAMSEAGKLTSAVMAQGVTAAFDKMTAAAASLPTTMAQASQRMANDFTRAAGESKTMAHIASVAIQAMGVVGQQAAPLIEGLADAAGVLAAVTGGRLVASLAASVTAMAAARAAAIADAAAKVEVTAAAVLQAEAEVALQGTKAALSLSTSGLAVAEGALANATRAAAVAQVELAAAQSLAARAGGAVLAIFGGPVGLIASLAIAAAGWFAYKAASTPGSETATLLANLKKQNEALRQNSQETKDNALVKAQAAVDEARRKPTVLESDAFGNTVEVENPAIAKALADQAELKAVLAENAKLTAPQSVSAGTGHQLKDAPKSLAELQSTLKTRTQVMEDYAQRVKEINAAADAALGDAAGGGRGVAADKRAQIEGQRSELLKEALRKRNADVATLNTEGAQLSAAAAAQRRQQLENDNAAEVRLLDAQLAALQQRYQLGQASLAENVAETSRIEREKLTAQARLIEQEIALEKGRKPKDAAEATQVATQVDALRGRLAAVRAELNTLGSSVPKALVDALAKLRTDSEALAGFDLADPIARSEAAFSKRLSDVDKLVAAYQQLAVPAPVSRPDQAVTPGDVSRYERARDAAGQQAAEQAAEWQRRATAEHVQSARDAARDIVDANRAANVALIRDEQQRIAETVAMEREQELRRLEPLRRLPAEYDAATAALNERMLQRARELTEQAKPEWQRLTDSWGDATATMRTTWDDAISGMVSGAADAFGKFVSGQQVSLKSLGQSALYTVGKGAFESTVGQTGLGGWLKQLTGRTNGGTAAASGTAARDVSSSTPGVSGVTDLVDGARAVEDAATAGGEAMSTAAAAFSNPITGLANAGQSLVQSAMGWLLPQSAQTTAATTLTSSAMGLSAAAQALSAAAASLSAGGGGGGLLSGLSALFGGGGASGSVVDAGVESMAVFAARGMAVTPSGAQRFATGAAFSDGAGGPGRRTQEPLSNRVHTRETDFTFQEGGQSKAGKLAEAGPEAVMPLAQSAQGLAVRLVGPGGQTTLAPLVRDAQGRLAAQAPGSGGNVAAKAASSEAPANGEGVRPTRTAGGSFPMARMAGLSRSTTAGAAAAPLRYALGGVMGASSGTVQPAPLRLSDQAAGASRSTTGSNGTGSDSGSDAAAWAGGSRTTTGGPATAAKPSVVLTMSPSIQIDARTDAADVAKAVMAGMTATRKQMWADLRARGFA